MNKFLTDKHIIDNYLLEKLDKDARYVLEKQSLNDPFIYDALEGFEIFSSTEEDIKSLNALIQNRIVKAKPKPWYYQQWGIAASIILIIAAGTIIFNQYEESKPISLNEFQTTTVEDNNIGSESEIEGNVLKQNNVNENVTKQNNSRKVEKSVEKESSSIVADSSIQIASVENEASIENQSMASKSVAPEAKTINSSQAISLQDILSKSVSTQIPFNEILNFQNYIDKNSKINDIHTGRVILLFQVDINGMIKNVKVLDSLNKLADDRAVKLLKNYHRFNETKLDQTLWLTVEVNFTNP